MTGFGAVKEVALREIKERGKSKAYLFASAFTLLIIVGLVVLPGLIGGDTNEYDVGTVGEGNAKVVEASLIIANADDEPDAEPSVAIEMTGYDNISDGKSALEEGDIDILMVDGQELIERSGGGLGGSSLERLLQRGAATVGLEAIVEENGQAAQDVIEVMTSQPLKISTLSGDDPDDDSKGFIAYIGLMLLYIAILLYGTWILTGVTEEKTNRVVEVLLASVRPWQLLTGKILGIGALGLLQFGLTILIGFGAVKLVGSVDIPEIPTESVINLIVWFLIGFMLYAVLFAAAGSLVSRMEDAQTAALPMTMIAVAGMFISIAALNDPESTIAVVGTFIPLTAPFVVPVRAALDGIPAWQYVGALVITIGTIVVLINVAGRIYAGGLLQFGGKVKLKDAWNSAVD